jgi:hypothetical protein
MKTDYCLLKNNTARVSFAVLGIFLILGSSATSVYIGMYSHQHNEKFTWDTTQQQVELLLATVRDDIARIINNAGINALQYISSHPVISPSQQFESADAANRYRLKRRIAEVLTNYLHCHHGNNQYCSGKINAKVDFFQLPLGKIPDSFIELEPVSMNLNRAFAIPFFGPELKQTYPVYYEVSCDIPLLITSATNHSSMPLSTWVSISTIITTRYLLLEQLIYSFNESLHGLGPFWKTFTVLTNLYSMARGYQHYLKGKPYNVVDNKHLELITNLVLLFEEASFFAGINPRLLVESIQQSKSFFSNDQYTHNSSLNALNSNGFSIPFSEFQQMHTSNTDESKDTLQQSQLINLSEIAASILWNYSTVQLNFIDKTHKKQTIHYDVRNTASIEDTVQHYIDKGWQFIDSSKGDCVINQSTNQWIQSLSESIYSAEFHTKIQRDGPYKITYGSHQTYQIDNGSSPWIVHHVKLQSKTGKPKKETISLGSTIHKEIYTVMYKRVHTWSNKTTISSGNTSRVHWTKMNTTDTKIEHNITFSIIFDSYGYIDSISGEIKNVCYYNSLFNDSNLMTTLPLYLSRAYNKHKQGLFLYDEGNNLQKKINESVPSWVIPAAYTAMQDVYNQLSTIQVDDDINPVNYPNPNELLVLAYQDILEQFQTNKSYFLQKHAYLEDTLFQSTARKVIFAIKKWYLDCIEHRIEQTSTQVKENMNDVMSSALESTEATEQDYNEVMKSDVVSSLQRQIVIPFSMPMNLCNTGVYEFDGWNESVTVSIDHHPDYWSCFSKQTYEGKEEYFIGIRNTCVLGPSGLPILPITPTTPWIVSVNTWLIQIRGEFAEFSVFDTGDETVFHPLFCYEPLEYTRKYEVIRASDGTILGWNKRITCSVDTLACSLVPSWGCMIGDTEGNIVEHNGRPFS